MVFELLLRMGGDTSGDKVKPVFLGEEGKKAVILWEPRTESDKRLLELYAVEEDEILDSNRNRSHGNGKGRHPGQESDKAGRMREEEA